MPDDITLRSPAPDELRAWIDPLLSAFAEDYSDPEFQSERPLLEPERLINAFDGERRIAGGHVDEDGSGFAAGEGAICP